MDSVLSVIANPKSSQASIIESLRSIGNIKAPPEFWIDIADDFSFSEDTRRRAIFMLFKHHIRSGISLEELGEILRNPSWLRKDNISLVQVIGGELPIEFSLSDSIIVIKIFPDLPEGRLSCWAIYLKIEGKINSEAFYKIMSNERIGMVGSGNRKLLEFGLSPNDPENIHF